MTTLHQFGFVLVVLICSAVLVGFVFAVLILEDIVDKKLGEGSFGLMALIFATIVLVFF